MISLILADDHQLFRQGLRALLASHRDIDIIAEAVDGQTTVQTVRAREPDVLLLDLGIPGIHGLGVLAELRGQVKTHCIVVSMHCDQGSVCEALRLGARGYLSKDTPGAEVVQAVRAVAAGDVYLSAELKALALPHLLARVRNGGQVDAGDGLTPRERMVLQGVAEGKTTAQIAELYSISGRTVEKHRASFMSKLFLKSPADVVRYALRKKMIPE